ncbi:hypothetical protein [Streptomyces mutabilis]|uniref:Uncharacterized protein n=1 Tax=Streptomyces mutabilis TaxID=67332 RepID=A0A086MR47_9ACTN|nr:hypothetical protein [Streptomyces mutabilis]KFG71365.1 hypothetical protein FM21_34270 [Streptomyces mutabilis]
MREREYLTRAARHPDGHVPGEASARLVEGMLMEGWIYREDRDGFRLEPEEALAFRGRTAWKITPEGRWAALGLRQRVLLAGARTGSLPLACDDVRTKVSMEMHLAEAVGGAVGLTVLGDELVRAFVTSGDGGQP